MSGGYIICAGGITRLENEKVPRSDARDLIGRNIVRFADYFPASRSTGCKDGRLMRRAGLFEGPCKKSEIPLA